MNEQKLVDKAVLRGQLAINLPALIILIVVLGSFIYLQRRLEYPEVFMLIGLPAGILISWFFWSMTIGKWKVWAYANVNDIDLLKTEAVKGKLLWPEKSFFNSTALYSKSQKTKLNKLENKNFKIPFPKIELSDLPVKTVIKYSIGNTIFIIGLPVFMSLVGLKLILDDAEIFGSTILFLSLVKLYKDYKKSINRDYTIVTLDNNGISLGDNNILWKEVLEAEAFFGTNGRETQELKVKTNENFFIVNIGDYNLPADKINERIYIYRNKAPK